MCCFLLFLLSTLFTTYARCCVHFTVFFWSVFLFFIWLRWVSVAVRRLSPVVAVGATLGCSVQAPHCGGLSRSRARALGTRASVVVARGLSSCGSRAPERRLSRCGARDQLLRGIWDPPRVGLEPMSPALVGGLLTTEPPGKPPFHCCF